MSYSKLENTEVPHLEGKWSCSAAYENGLFIAFLLFIFYNPCIPSYVILRRLFGY